jgi:hypothetical protein
LLQKRSVTKEKITLKKAQKLLEEDGIILDEGQTKLVLDFL